jgi:hypothetical protein
MPLVPHPPSVSRQTSGASSGQPESDEHGAASRVPSGGRPRDVSSFALARNKNLPTLNFVKLKQDTKAELDQALAQGGGSASQRVGTSNGASSVRARQYAAGAGGGAVGGQGARPPNWASGNVPARNAATSGQGPRAAQAPNAGGAPAPRRVVPAGVAGEGGGLMPRPPPTRSNGIAGAGDGAAGPGSDLPDRNKQEPTHPLTARHPPAQEDKAKQQSEAAQRQPMTARPAARSDAAEGEHKPIAPQRYDEVSKPSVTGGSNVPLTPAAALKLYMSQMTLYEQGEILDYPQVMLYEQGEILD